MRRSLAYPIGIILVVLIGIFFYLKLCSCCRVHETATTKSTTEQTVPNALEEGKAKSQQVAITSN